MDKQSVVNSMLIIYTYPVISVTNPCQERCRVFLATPALYTICLIINTTESIMTEKKLPKVVSQEMLNLQGMELMVCVLDDGQRVIDAESLEVFFKNLGFSNDE